MPSGKIFCAENAKNTRTVMRKLLDSTVSAYLSLEEHLLLARRLQFTNKKPVSYRFKKGRRIIFLMRTPIEAEEARIPLLQRCIH